MATLTVVWCESILASTLGCLQAVKIFLRLRKAVQCRCLCGSTIRLPFLVFLFTLWPVSLAIAIDHQIVAFNLVHAVHVHALLGEQILAPCLVAIKFLMPLPIQRRLALVQVIKVFTHRCLADYLQGTKETISHIRAILKVYPVVRHYLVLQFGSQPHGQEHSFWVCFHCVILAFPNAFLLDCLPHLDEDTCISPC